MFIRIIFFFLRIIFGIILIYYLFRLLFRWMFPLRMEKKETGNKKGEEKDEFYKYLTNQEIEDAEFEELNEEEEKGE